MPLVPDLPDLSAQVVGAYQRTLDGEALPPETPGLDALLSNGLAATYPFAPDTYTAVEPQYAALKMMHILHARLGQLTAYAGVMPELLVELRDRYQAARPSDKSIEHLAGRTPINQHIAAEHSAARKEILASQPGPRSAEDLAHSFERDRAGLQRGLAMRTVYHGSVRRVAAVGDWARNIAAAGGEVRTAQGRFARSIIFDRRVAFVPVYTSEGEPPGDEAVMITDPLVVGQIAHGFDLLWERADQWEGRRDNPDEGMTTNAIQRCILRELCLGRTQAQAAKNLGISSAWVNKQMGELRAKLGVGTLNEVIYWWASSPDHDVQD
ncbi:hypothetical protein ACFWVC_11280 [Streptomyces sp. NPDC058691]|uniref:hypothetical protein n=1 Tax=Streptomyces sp. NPDC058691 TaxID=3346601 RepID=UPI0036568431